MNFKYHIYYFDYKNKKKFLNKRIILIYFINETPKVLGTLGVSQQTRKRKKFKMLL